MGLLKRIYDWLLSLFWATEMDITMIGLQNAGKTSLLRVLAGGEFTIDSIPTVGFNMKRVQKGHVTLKCWDLGGQPRFRSMWERYCRGVNAIVYVDVATEVFIVDSADKEALPVAKEELHILLEKPAMEGIPLLVLGNKSDLQDHCTVDDLIEALELKKVTHREVSCYGISAKEETNLDAVLQWLIARRAIRQQDGCAPAMAGRRRMSSTTGSLLLRGVGTLVGTRDVGRDGRRFGMLRASSIIGLSPNSFESSNYFSSKKQWDARNATPGLRILLVKYTLGPYALALQTTLLHSMHASVRSPTASSLAAIGSLNANHGMRCPGDSSDCGE
ncbi:ras small GTPase [Hortaea werneckii]|nr:ras small GTPase [Hortaea werneckii]